MGHIGSLQKYVVTKYTKNCYGEKIASFKTISILTLSSYLHGRTIDVIKNISLLFSRQEFDNLHRRKIGLSRPT